MDEITMSKRLVFAINALMPHPMIDSIRGSSSIVNFKPHGHSLKLATNYLTYKFTHCPSYSSSRGTDVGAV